MEAVLTVRLDRDVKERGTAVMGSCGHTPSSAVRALFEYAVKHESLPFKETSRLDAADVCARIAAFDACHTLEPLTMTDDEVREERLGSRYGLDA